MSRQGWQSRTGIVCAAAAMLLALPHPAAARTHKARHSHPAPKAARADPPVLLGNFADWSAYSRGDGDSQVCYALSEPKTQDPAKAKRDPAYFLINDWPSRKSKAEAEIVPGYTYKKGSTVSVKVGGDKFVFFTKNDGDAGGAWVLKKSDEDNLVAALRGGSTVTVTGTSSRGTETKDTYGLDGVSDALDKIHAACRMRR